MRKGYLGSSGAQIHVLEFGEGGVPLLCLPPAPHTGAYFETILPFISKTRLVQSLDYPGYGGSDRIEGKVTISAYAERLLKCLDAGAEFDLLGFHTGNLVAAEIAKMCPSQVRKITMIDVPYFDTETRKRYASSLSDVVSTHSITDSYKKSVEGRGESVAHARAYSLWIESLRSGPCRNDAFRAAFDYDCDVSFPKLDTPVKIIATQSSLLENSKNAAKLLPNASLVEALHISSPVFEAYTNEIASLILME